MDDLLDNIGKLIALFLGFVGVSKAAMYPLSKRVKVLEDAPAKREVTECQRLQVACPVAVRLAGLEKTSDGFARWMERIEAKLDRVIEERHK